MPRFLLGLALIAMLAVQVVSVPALAAIVSIDEAKSEMSIGNAGAPVTIIEYSSLGCPNCANFHKNTLPQIKKNYIDTGKVRLVYRDFPLGTAALAASMIARCAGPKKYFGFVEILFRAQAQWSRSKDPMQALSKIARFGGLSDDDVQACLKRQTLLEHISKGALVGQEKHKVDSTPFFIIGDATVSGAQPFDAFKKVLDKALSK